MTRAALALALGLLASPAAAHDLFADLSNAKGQRCCGKQDCRLVDECVLPDGKQGLVIEARCTPIPPGTTLGMASPDGKSHACYGYDLDGRPFIRCAILPGEV